MGGPAAGEDSFITRHNTPLKLLAVKARGAVCSALRGAVCTGWKATVFRSFEYECAGPAGSQGAAGLLPI